MQRIIDGLRYDTETATRIGGYSYSNPSDFKYIAEDLYVTKSGKYFIAGEGGAMTKYSEQVDNNSWGDGSGITVLENKEDAFQWAQEHLKTSEIEEHFNDMIKDA